MGVGQFLEGLVRFDRFDDDKKPRLIQSRGVILDVEHLDYGYDSIISIREECPDDYCADRKTQNGLDELGAGLC